MKSSGIICKLSSETTAWLASRSIGLEVKANSRKGMGWTVKVEPVDKVEKGAITSLTYHSWRLLTYWHPCVNSWLNPLNMGLGLHVAVTTQYLWIMFPCLKVWNLLLLLVHHPFTNSFAGSTKNRQRLKKNFVNRCKSTKCTRPCILTQKPLPCIYLRFIVLLYISKSKSYESVLHTHISQRFATCHTQTWCISFTYILPAKIATQSRKNDVHQKHHAASHPTPLCKEHLASSSHVFNLPSLRTNQKQPWSRTSKLEKYMKV